jgi:hypothetical protein
VFRTVCGPLHSWDIPSPSPPVQYISNNQSSRLRAAGPPRRRNWTICRRYARTRSSRLPLRQPSATVRSLQALLGMGAESHHGAQAWSGCEVLQPEAKSTRLGAAGCLHVWWRSAMPEHQASRSWRSQAPSHPVCATDRCKYGIIACITCGPRLPPLHHTEHSCQPLLLPRQALSTPLLLLTAGYIGYKKAVNPCWQGRGLSRNGRNMAYRAHAHEAMMHGALAQPKLRHLQ